jgi:hypothetical protein
VIRSPTTRLPCLRLGTGQSGATLATCILRDGSPRPQADMWSSEIAPDFGDKGAMIAYERDGEELGDKGLRVVMPGDQAWRALYTRRCWS